MRKNVKIPRSKLIKNCFSLDEIDSVIIKIIAIFGPLNKNQIVNHSTFTKRQIEYRLETTLLSNNFVKILKKRPYRNIKNAYGSNELFERIYNLDNKGLFVSLALVKAKKNFFVKYYVEQCPKEIGDTLYNYIKSEHDLFYKFFSHIGLGLDNLRDIDSFIMRFAGSPISLRTGKGDDLELIPELLQYKEEIFKYRLDNLLSDDLNDSKLNWLENYWYTIGATYPKKIEQKLREEEREGKRIEKLGKNLIKN